MEAVGNSGTRITPGGEVVKDGNFRLPVDNDGSGKQSSNDDGHSSVQDHKGRLLLGEPELHRGTTCHTSIFFSSSGSTS